MILQYLKVITSVSLQSLWSDYQLQGWTVSLGSTCPLEPHHGAPPLWRCSPGGRCSIYGEVLPRGIPFCRLGDTAGIAGGSMCPASGEQNALGFAQGRETAGCEVQMSLHGCWDANRRLGLGVPEGKPNSCLGQLTESSHGRFQCVRTCGAEGTGRPTAKTLSWVSLIQSLSQSAHRLPASLLSRDLRGWGGGRGEDWEQRGGWGA